MPMLPMFQSMFQYLRKINHKTLVLFCLLTLIVPSFAYGDWLDDLVTETQNQIDQFETVNADGLDISTLLPLDLTNTWTYEFDELSDDGFVPEEQVANLGELETIGDLCIRPLVFQPSGLKLYIANHDDRIVFYGFSTIVNTQEVEFFFRDGELSSVASGINLVGLDAADLLLDEQGSQPTLLNDDVVNLAWFVINKSLEVQPEPMSIFTYNGFVDGISETASSSDPYEFSLDLRLDTNTCESSLPGCFAGRFGFEFVEGVGITRLLLRGFLPQLGGDFLHQYTLLESAMPAFDLSNERNQISFYSCDLPSSNDIKRDSVGMMHNWFNTLLLFVVLLGVYCRIKTVETV